jgi:protein SCO1/2
MSLHRYWLFLTAFIFLAILLGALFLSRAQVGQSLFERSHFAFQLFLPMDTENFGGAFTLQKADGSNIHSSAIDADYKLIYFGFTHCSYVCPLTLQMMANAVELLPLEYNSRVQLIFVSIDPFRDSPSDAYEYARVMGEGFLGLSGTPKQIEEVTKQFKVFAQRIYETKADDNSLDYNVNHTSFIYLLNKDDKIIGHFTVNNTAKEMSQEILKLMKNE